MIIGYARVSTTDQNLDAQTDALTAVGAERLFSERVSGAKAERPELDKMLDQLRDGDVVVVTKYDRLARSLRDLLDIVEAIKGRGAGFRSLAEDIDTTTPAGELIFHVFASIAHFERRRIAERTREGLEAARKRGRVGGRPPALTPDQKTEVIRMRDEESRPLREIAGLFKISIQEAKDLKEGVAEQTLELRPMGTTADEVSRIREAGDHSAVGRKPSVCSPGIGQCSAFRAPRSTAGTTGICSAVRLGCGVNLPSGVPPSGGPV